MRISPATFTFLFAVVAGSSWAHADGPGLAPGDDGLPGLFRTDSADVIPEGLGVGLYGSFGLSGELLESEDSHRRSGSRLQLSYGLSESLAFAVRLDGRYDQHFEDGSENDDGWVGDPRLLVRYRHELSPGLAIAGQLGLWFPGQDAPSVIVDAITPEIGTALTYRAMEDALGLSCNLGYRLDRSAGSIDNPELLSAADRLALGLSSSDAVLIAAGASYDFGPVEALAEWSMDLLLGDDAPAAGASPMRASLGLRKALGDNLVAQAVADVRLNSVELPMDPTVLVPVEPGFQAIAGVQYLFDFGSDDAPDSLLTDVDPKDGNEDEDENVKAEPTENPLVVRLSGKNGGLDGATVALLGQDGVTREAARQDDGSFLFDDVPKGSYELQISAPGYDRAARALSVDGAIPDIAIDMIPALPPGQLRGAIRSFRGKGIAASIRITKKDVEEASATPFELTSQGDGSFSIDLPPGAYSVEIQANNFKSQTRQVKIEQDGVTILNVDLRK